MDINANQNTLAGLKLLAAQRQFYNWAKKWIGLNYFSTLFIALYAPFGFYLYPESKFLVGAIGASWTLVSLLINLKEQSLTSKAAKIQEQFDTEVFGLEWKSIIAGNKVSPEEIDNAFRQYKGNIDEDFGDWYVGIGKVPYPQSVLLAQRQNLNWDYRLRRFFARLLIVIVFLVFALGLTISIIEEAKLVDYALGLFLPSLSATIKGVREIIGHFKIANEKERLEGLVNDLLGDLESVTVNQLRDIQDKIYIERCKAPMIPNSVHKLLKKRYTENTLGAIEQITTTRQ